MALIQDMLFLEKKMRNGLITGVRMLHPHHVQVLKMSLRTVNLVNVTIKDLGIQIIFYQEICIHTIMSGKK